MKNEDEKKYITVPLWRAVGIFAGAIIVSIVGTAFAVANTINSDHFTLLSVSGRVAALETQTVSKEVYKVQHDIILEKIADLKLSVDSLAREVRSLDR